MFLIYHPCGNLPANYQPFNKLREYPQTVAVKDPIQWCRFLMQSPVHLRSNVSVVRSHLIHCKQTCTDGWYKMTLAGVITVHFNFTILTYHLWIAILCNKKHPWDVPPSRQLTPAICKSSGGPGGRWRNRSKHHWNWWVPQPLKINCRSRDGQNWDPQKLQLVRGAGDGVVKPWFVWVGWVSCARVVLELDRF